MAKFNELIHNSATLVIHGKTVAVVTSLIRPIVCFLRLDVRLLLDPVKILVQAVQQKCHQLLRVLLLVARELRLEPTDRYLKRTPHATQRYE